MIDIKNRHAKPLIVIVSPFLPYPPRDGGRLKMYNSIKTASERYEILLLSFIANKEEAQSIPHLKTFCKEVFTVWFRQDTVVQNNRSSYLPEVVKFFYSDRIKSELLQIIRNYPVDLVQTEYTFMAYCTKDIQDIPTVLVEYDTSLFFLRGSYERPLYGRWNRIRDWIKKVKFHRDAYRSFDRIVVFTEEEKRTVQALAPKADISVVPIGIDINSYDLGSSDHRSFDLIFIGYMGHYPNVDGINYFCNKIFPLIQQELPQIKLYILGSGMKEEVTRLGNKKNIQVIGEVEDVRPYLAKAKIFIAPLRLGRGLRVKILEAMAMGLPVVATSVVGKGINAIPGRDIFIADGPKKFATEVIRLIQDKRLCRETASNSRLIIEKYYNCVNTQRQLEAIYGEMIRQKNTSRMGFVQQLN